MHRREEMVWGTVLLIYRMEYRIVDPLPYGSTRCLVLNYGLDLKNRGRAGKIILSKQENEFTV